MVVTLHGYAFDGLDQIELLDYQKLVLDNLDKLSDNQLDRILRFLDCDHPFNLFFQKLELEQLNRKFRTHSEQKNKDLELREQQILAISDIDENSKQKVENFLKLSLQLGDPNITILVYELMESFSLVGLRIKPIEITHFLSFIILKLKSGIEFHGIPTYRIMASPMLHVLYPEWYDYYNFILRLQEDNKRPQDFLKNMLSVPFFLDTEKLFNFQIQRKSVYSSFVLFVLQRTHDYLISLHFDGEIVYKASVKSMDLISRILVDVEIPVPYCHLVMIGVQDQLSVFKQVNLVWRADCFGEVSYNFFLDLGFLNESCDVLVDNDILELVNDQLLQSPRESIKTIINQKEQERKKKPSRKKDNFIEFCLYAKKLYSSFDEVTALNSLMDEFDEVIMRVTKTGPDHRLVWKYEIDTPYRYMGGVIATHARKKTARMLAAQRFYDVLMRAFDDYQRDHEKEHAIKRFNQEKSFYHLASDKSEPYDLESPVSDSFLKKIRAIPPPDVYMGYEDPCQLEELIERFETINRSYKQIRRELSLSSDDNETNLEELD
jgi:hypothetical protein